jgi:caffeoyl-CoA O-methyltransferase
MSWIPNDVENYCIAHSTRPSSLARELQEHTRQHVHGSQMLIGEMEGSLLQFLIRLGKVKTVLELGTYTGYSALVMAEALPEEGKLITIDINPHTSEIAKSYWSRSPSGKKIEQILKPGPQALVDLEHNFFDLIFIDADKKGYPHYLNWATTHLNTAGLIITDNTLWYGKVLEAEPDAQTQSILEHNTLAANLTGFTKTLLPVRDGMFLLQKG